MSNRDIINFALNDKLSDLKEFFSTSMNKITLNRLNERKAEIAQSYFAKKDSKENENA